MTLCTVNIRNVMLAVKARLKNVAYLVLCLHAGTTYSTLEYGTSDVLRPVYTVRINHVMYYTNGILDTYFGSRTPKAEIRRKGYRVTRELKIFSWSLKLIHC